MQGITMKNLIAAVAVLMAASFAQADEVLIQISYDKVTACKTELQIYDTPGKKCAAWDAWVLSANFKKLGLMVKNEPLRFTSGDNLLLGRLTENMEYVNTLR